MKILYVTSEVSPYSESGGLGDVMGALPEAIARKNKEIEVVIISPLYKSTAAKYKDKMTKLLDLSFKLSWRSTGAAVYMLNKGKITYYFIENQYYFDREWLYGEFDDGERFAFFNTAIIEFMLKSGDIPDILHANDWQTALSIIYLKTIYSHAQLLSKIKTVFSIHNIEYQGKYDTAILGDVFALSSEHRPIVEFDGCINLLKGALISADYVLTVSPNYANELYHNYFSFGLSDVIAMISGKMSGIMNGIDYSVFSPKDQDSLYYTYDKRSLKSGKTKNKLALQEELGLLPSEETPLVVMISRLTEGKGIDLVLHIAEELLTEDIQMVVLGTGEQIYEDYFRSLDARYKNFRAIIGFDRKLSKKLYAASDIFLMPSKREPCGLAQMIATAYGSVPIVHSIGGLKDSIIPYGYEGYNGFSFENYNAHELLFTVKSALNLYKDQKEWAQIRRNAINSDFSWDSSAEKYIDIYNKI